ncbi:hypothetical protein [Amycolatopsis thermoflava]
MQRYSMRWFCVRLFGLPLDSRLWNRLQQTRADGDVSIEDVDRELGIVRE